MFPRISYQKMQFLIRFSCSTNHFGSRLIWISVALIVQSGKPARTTEVKTSIYALFLRLTYFFPAMICLNPNRHLEKVWILGLYRVLEQLRVCSRSHLSLFAESSQSQSLPELLPVSGFQSLSLETLLDSCGILTGIPPATPPQHTHSHSHTLSFFFSLYAIISWEHIHNLIFHLPLIYFFI